MSLKNKSLLIFALFVANIGFSQRTTPGSTVGGYTFPERYTTSNGTVYEVAYGSDKETGKIVDGLKAEYSECDVKVDTSTNNTRQPLTKFQNGYSIPGLGNMGVAAQAGGAAEQALKDMLKKITDKGHIYMKEKSKEYCPKPEEEKIKKLVYEIRMYKLDKGKEAKARWMLDYILFRQGRGPQPGPANAPTKKDSMTVKVYKVTIECECNKEEEVCCQELEVTGALSTNKSLKINQNVNNGAIVNLIPNPVSRGENLTLGGLAETTIRDVSIIDLSGRTVYNRFNLSENRIDINTSNFNKGVYLVHIVTEKGNSRTNKLIVK